MEAGLKLGCHLSQLDIYIYIYVYIYKLKLELRPCLRDAHEAQGTFPLSHTCLAPLVKIIYIYIYIYIYVCINCGVIVLLKENIYV